MCDLALYDNTARSRQAIIFERMRHCSMTGSKREQKIICRPVPKAVLDACLKQQAHRSTPSTFEKNCWLILRVTPFPTPQPFQPGWVGDEERRD